MDHLICASFSHTHYWYEVGMFKCNWLKSVRSAAVVRFSRHHVVELENKLRMGYEHGFFQNNKFGEAERDKQGRIIVRL